MRRDVGLLRSHLAHRGLVLDDACPSSRLHLLSLLFYTFPFIDSPRKWVFSQEEGIAVGTKCWERGG